MCLFLRERDHVNKSYGPFQDLILSSKVSLMSYSEMARQVGEKTGESVESLVLYKYDQSSYEYQLISSRCPNLRKAPVSLKEGDVIAYGTTTQDHYQYSSDPYLEHL